jgi:hypothetical protein
MLPSYILPILKELYDGQKVENLVLKDHAFVAMVRKNSKFYGKSYPQPVQHGVAVGGRSSRFSAAKANKSNNRYKQFSLTRFSDYALVSIQNEAIEAAEHDKGAFIRELKTETDGAIIAARESQARDAFGTGTGLMGQIKTSGGISGATVTLQDVREALKFEVDMVVVLSTDNGGGAVEVGDLTISKVDRKNGVITFDQNVTAGIPTAANGMFIFVDGDYDNKMPGLHGWIPPTEPGPSDNFFGVNRSVDPERLAGYRFDGSSMSPEEALIYCVADLNDRGGNPTHVFMNSYDYTNLELSLGSKIQYVTSGAFGRADITFQGIKLNSRKGRPLTVLAEPFGIKGHSKVLQLDTWTLHSLKEAIRILMPDGLKMLRDSDDDSSELRVGGYKVLGCSAPGWNADCKMPS